MKLSLPTKVRRALYVLTAAGTPIVAYLQVKGLVGEPEMVLWAAEVTVVSTIAGLHTGDG
ncbi:hypothetical protein [Pimelobacter simplex]|uniref:hypothetical protein n=1 Tax=Nocardioides simplex TaxID=2045 RepID=UPI003AB07FC2